MRCLRCGSERVDTDNFCAKCGAAMAPPLEVGSSKPIVRRGVKIFAGTVLGALLLLIVASFVARLLEGHAEVSAVAGDATQTVPVVAQNTSPQKQQMSDEDCHQKAQRVQPWMCAVLGGMDENGPMMRLMNNGAYRGEYRVENDKCYEYIEVSGTVAGTSFDHQFKCEVTDQLAK
jgi:hypothetical protein